MLNKHFDMYFTYIAMPEYYCAIQINMHVYANVMPSILALTCEYILVNYPPHICIRQYLKRYLYAHIKQHMYMLKRTYICMFK